MKITLRLAEVDSQDRDGKRYKQVGKRCPRLLSTLHYCSTGSVWPDTSNRSLVAVFVFPFPPPPALGFWNPTTNVDEANARPPLNAIATMVDMGYHDA